MQKFALYSLLIGICFSISAAFGQEVKATAYPDLKVYEFIESSHSAQYYLAQNEKPQKCMLYLKMREGGIDYSIRTVKGQKRSKGFFFLDDKGNWQVEIDHHAPGYGKIMCFAMDRMGQEADTLLILKLNQKEKPFPCHRSCIDSCLEGQHQLEVKLDIAKKPKMALKAHGFKSGVFQSLYVESALIWTAYRNCKRECF